MPFKPFKRKPWTRGRPTKRPEYEDKEFRKILQQVKRRDKHKCQFPNCTAKKHLQVHHIKKYADFPTLRKNPINLITLCRTHHDLIKGREEHFEQLFFSLLRNNEKMKEVNKEKKKREKEVRRVEAKEKAKQAREKSRPEREELEKEAKVKLAKEYLEYLKEQNKEIPGDLPSNIDKDILEDLISVKDK